MVAEVQKIEAAARMAMGHFEGQAAGAKPAKPRHRFSYPAYALLGLAVVGLAFALL
jgi:hypothetical protein